MPLPQVQHTDEGEALLKELDRRLNVTGTYIQQRTIFGDLIEFWKTQATALRAFNFEDPDAPVEFNTRWLSFAGNTETKLEKLLIHLGWPFVGAHGLDTCVARLFRFTLDPKVKARAWDHLRKFTTHHFRGSNRIGLTLPAWAFQVFNKTGRKEDIAAGLAACVNDIVKEARTTERLSASMDKAVETFGTVPPAEDNVFCIFDVTQKSKLALENAAENGKFSDRVAALILQRLKTPQK